MDNLISKIELIDWLNGKKYKTVDETSDNMSVGFESDHQWELSRNCFINDTIKHIQEMSAVEAERTQYGEWKEEEFQSYIPVEYDDLGNPILHTYKTYRCDQCGCTRKNIYPYCNCGAKMSNYKSEKDDPTHDMKKAATQQILLRKTIKGN